MRWLVKAQSNLVSYWHYSSNARQQDNKNTSTATDYSGKKWNTAGALGSRPTGHAGESGRSVDEVDFNCYNQFIYVRQVMNTITNPGYKPEELFSQKGSTTEDANFDKTLMAEIYHNSHDNQ